VYKYLLIFLHRLGAEEGSKVAFDKVLLMNDSGKINVGAPVIIGAKVTAKVLEHLKDDKVIVFKKKRRKGYKVKNGHRQHLTKLEIQNIEAKAPAVKKPATKKAPAKTIVVKKPAAKKAPAKTTAVRKSATKKAPAKTTAVRKSATKKAPAKTTAVKKPPAKKASVKKPAAKKSE
jgi:large subunit ribosomal protein L21